jgi:hypothetical protein
MPSLKKSRLAVKENHREGALPIQVPQTLSAFHPLARRTGFRRCDYVYHPSLNRWIQTALSNSKNAVSISSARTMKRFP